MHTCGESCGSRRSRAGGLVGRALALELEIASKVGWTGRLLLSKPFLLGGPIARAEHSDSEAAVVESREPQPRPAAACYGPVSRPGSSLRSGALGLGRASLLAPSRLLSSFGGRSEGRPLRTGRTQSPAISLGMSESTRDQRMPPQLAPVAFVDLTVPRAPRQASPPRKARPLRTRARARRTRGRTPTEKEGAVAGAEAGKRASVGMASSGATAESAGTRGKRQAGRGGDGRSRRRRGGRRGRERRSRERNARMAVGAPPSASTGSAGLSARTAGAPQSASTTESGASARTAGAPPSASTTARGAGARTAGAPASASITA